MIKIAQSGLIIILSLFLILHFLVLLKIIPYTLVWGGRLKSDKEMYRFEIISIGMNALLVLVVLVQANFIVIDIPRIIITYALWVMAGLFLLNTFANATSKNRIEQRVFTPVTILLTIFCLILAWSN